MNLTAKVPLVPVRTKEYRWCLLDVFNPLEPDIICIYDTYESAAQYKRMINMRPDRFEIRKVPYNLRFD